MLQMLTAALFDTGLQTRLGESDGELSSLKTKLVTVEVDLDMQKKNVSKLKKQHRSEVNSNIHM